MPQHILRSRLVTLLVEAFLELCPGHHGLDASPHDRTGLTAAARHWWDSVPCSPLCSTIKTNFGLIYAIYAIRTPHLRELGWKMCVPPPPPHTLARRSPGPVRGVLSILRRIGPGAARWKSVEALGYGSHSAPLGTLHA